MNQNYLMSERAEIALVFWILITMIFAMAFWNITLSRRIDKLEQSSGTR